MSASPHRVDVHHHILPSGYTSALAGQGITGGGGIPFPAWNESETLAMMDRQGIQAAVTSISTPGVHFGDAAFARDLARRCNEVSAGLVRDHPARFGGFAFLPLPEVKDAQATGLTLCHLRLHDDLGAAVARAVLQGYRNRYRQLVDVVTEREPSFREDLLAEVSTVDLLTAPISDVAAKWNGA